MSQPFIAFGFISPASPTTIKMPPLSRCDALMEQMFGAGVFPSAPTGVAATVLSQQSATISSPRWRRMLRLTETCCVKAGGNCCHRPLLIPLIRRAGGAVVATRCLRWKCRRHPYSPDGINLNPPNPPQCACNGIAPGSAIRVAYGCLPPVMLNPKRVRWLSCWMGSFGHRVCRSGLR